MEQIIMIEKHFKVLLDKALKGSQRFNLIIKRTAPEDVDVVGWAIYYLTDDLFVRLKHIYKTRKQAFAKLDDLLPPGIGINTYTNDRFK